MNGKRRLIMDMNEDFFLRGGPSRPPVNRKRGISDHTVRKVDRFFDKGFWVLMGLIFAFPAVGVLYGFWDAAFPVLQGFFEYFNNGK
jgi:hypothetical protein